MSEANLGASVSRTLGNYRESVPRFVIGDISADEFETGYLARFKGDPSQMVGEQFDILSDLIADVDDYISDPAPRESTRGISCEELRARARDAPTRLFDARQ
jgi:Bacterial self-protective colicin-like immunity